MRQAVNTFSIYDEDAEGCDHICVTADPLPILAVHALGRSQNAPSVQRQHCCSAIWRQTKAASKLCFILTCFKALFH